jgi:hypothetical protein
MKLNKIVALGFIFVSGIFFQIQTSLAEEVGFSIHSEPSKFQYNEKAGYYDLLLKPKQAEVIHLTIVNKENKENKFTVLAGSAQTSDNMTTMYLTDKKLFDKTLKVPFTSIARVDQSHVTVAPKSEKTVNVKIEIKGKVKGIIVGGIDIAKDVTVKKTSTGYNNRFAYLKTVVIRTATKKEKPNLNCSEVSQKVVGRELFLTTRLQNPKAAMVNDATIETTVIKKDTNKKIYEKTIGQRSVAANSHFDYATALDRTKLRAGKYLLKYKIVDYSGREWKFERPFTIKSGQVRKLNAVDENGEKKPFPWYWIVIAILFLIIIFLLLKRRKDDDEEEEAK